MQYSCKRLNRLHRRLVKPYLRAAPRQPELAGEHVVVAQPGQLARAEIEADDVRKVASAEARVEAERSEERRVGKECRL